MIGDGLGVGGADADVDQGDTAAVGCGEVPGRHLMTPPGALGRHPRRITGLGGDGHAAGADQTLIAPFAELARAPDQELVHIAVIVGEQDEGLDRIGGTAGVVGQPGQGEVGARPIEEAERPPGAGLGRPQAIGHLIADRRQLGGGEVLGDRVGGDVVEGQILRPIDDVGIRNLDVRAQHLGLDVEITEQQGQLLDQVRAEKVRPGDGGPIDSPLAEAGEGPRQALGRPLGHMGEAQGRIGVGAGAARRRIGRSAGRQPGGEIGSQRLNRARVFALQLVDDGGCVGEGVHRLV
jgi:hypothetical protein